MNDQLQKAQRRTLQYWYIDGLHELTFGGICLVVALLLFAQTTLPKGTLLYTILIISFVLVIMGSAFLVGKVVSAFKSRLTFPRTGYVAYRRKSRTNNWIIPLLGLGIVGLLALFIAKAPQSLNLMTAVTGIVLASVMLALGIRTGLLRFTLIGCISLILGGSLALTGIVDLLGLSIFYGSIGLVLGISGACTLRTYLRKAPAAQESQDGK